MPVRKVRLLVPSLHNGISEQPPSVRLPNQVETCQNVIFSVRDGASKRPGTWIERKFSSTGMTNQGCKLHTIDRDPTERYHVLVGTGGVVKVLEFGFLDATVTITPAATAYLTLNSPTRDQFRILTIGDTTFILNTTVPVATITTPAFVVNASHKTYDTLISRTPSENTYHRADADGTLGSKGHYKYSAGASITFATWVGPTLSGSSTADPTGVYDDSGNNPGGFKIAFQRFDVNIVGGTWTQATKRLVKTGAFASYTFRSGDQIYVTGGTGVTAGWRAIASKISNDEIELSTTTGFTGNNVNTTTDAIGAEFEVTVQLDLVALSDMYDVAERFQQALRDAGATDACVAWVATGAQAGRFEVTSPYRGSSATVFQPTAPTSGYDYTAVGRAFATGTINAGTGAPSTDTLPVIERWTRVAAPSQPNGRIDPGTMPVLLRRTAKSVAPSTPATFSCDVGTWDDRFSGDDGLNPAPSIFQNGSTLSDITYFRSRLGLAGGENVVWSQADNVFGYFAEDASNIIDSDPIDIQLASDQYTEVEFIVPVRRSVLIFTKAGRQFEMKPGETFAPGKVSVTPITAYKTLPIRPVTIDPAVYFLVQDEGAVQLYEYIYDDVALLSSAERVSAHTPRLVATRDINNTLVARPLSMVACPQTGMVIILQSIFNASTVYVGVDMFVYRAFYDGPNKVQSAWTQHVFYSFVPAGNEYLVYDISPLGDRLYMLTSHELSSVRYWYIERMALSAEQVGEDEVTTVRVS
jgi:hypothetical protein